MVEGRIEELKDEIHEKIELEFVEYSDTIIELNLEPDDLYNTTNAIIEKLQEKYRSNYRAMVSREYPLLNRRINTNKNRWYKEEINNKDSSYNKMIKVMKFQEKMNKIEQKRDSAKAIEKQKYELDDWLNDSERKLIEFPPLLHKGKRSILVALRNDIEKIILEFIDLKVEEALEEKKKESNMMCNKNIMKRYFTPMSSPITDGNYTTLKEGEMKNNGENYTHLDKYEIDEMLMFLSAINTESDEFNDLPISESDKRRILSRIHKTDIDILDSALSYNPEDLYKKNSVIVPIKDIVEDVYSEKSGVAYKHVEFALHKLKIMSFFINDKENNLQHSYSLLDSVKIYDEKNSRKRVAEIEVSTKLYEDIIEGRTIKLYKDSINKLESNFAHSIVFRLQAERLSQLLGNDYEEFKHQELDIGFFKRIVFLDINNIYRVTKRIEDALDELVENQLIIKDYEINGFSYNVEYLPIGKQEMEELVGDPEEVKKAISDSMFSK